MAEFKPIFSITNTIANNLLEIERVKEGIKTLPINPTLLASLRETAKIQTIHYSTQIEGNRLTQDEVKDLISKKKVVSNTGRIRDEKEIKGYYTALDYIEKLVKTNVQITEENIKHIIKLEIDKVRERLKAIGYGLQENIENTQLFEKIYNNVIEHKNMGARPIIREIQNNIEDKMTDYIIDNDIESGHIFSLEELS